MALCDTPPVVCNAPWLQSPQVQQYLMIKLLAALVGASTSDATLKTLAAGYICQGSPSKLNIIGATAIEGADLTGVDLPGVNCWSPLELSAVQAYLVCLAIDSL